MSNSNQNNENNDLLSLLDFSNNQSIEVIKVEIHDSTKNLHLRKELEPIFCPSCANRMHSKGIYKRTVKHPIFQDSTQLILTVHQRRWECSFCKLSFNDEFTFLQPGKQSTDLTPLMILNAMKDLNRTTKSIADQFSLSDTQVHDIFTAYVDLPRLPLPEYISIDEVCLKMHLNTYQIEEMFFNIDPRLKKLHSLKEEYISFNKSQYNSEEETEAALNRLIELYDNSHEAIFYNFSGFLKSHKKEIIHSFTTLQVKRKTAKDTEEYYARLSNGLMESLNRKPKDYRRASRGSSNFNYTRNRILWATRNNPSVLAIPETSENDIEKRPIRQDLFSLSF